MENGVTVKRGVPFRLPDGSQSVRMKPFQKAIYILLQLTWGILQNIGGFCVFLLLKIKGRKSYSYRGAIITQWDAGGSMGLGMFVFMGADNNTAYYYKVRVHEYGHTVQSVILGPLFLFVIGIPSLCWAGFKVFGKMRREKGIRYTDAYCEHWASSLGQKVTGEKAIWH